jgi:hypothetical protein
MTRDWLAGARIGSYGSYGSYGSWFNGLVGCDCFGLLVRYIY